MKNDLSFSQQFEVYFIWLLFRNERFEIFISLITEAHYSPSDAYKRLTRQNGKI